MKEEIKPTIDEALLAAWRRTLPETLDNEAASVQIEKDDTHSDKLLIHVTMSGRNQYTLDFSCVYLDTREVQVECIDAAKANRSVDVHADHIQDMIKQVTRDIHECAQALHPITHGS